MEYETDREVADYWIKHIQEPCVYAQTAQIYIREAKSTLDSFVDEKAKEDLLDTIKRSELFLSYTMPLLYRK